MRLPDLLPPSRRLPLAVMLLVLLLSLFAAALINSFVQDQQQTRFEREVRRYADTLTERLSAYEKLLLGTRAFWQVQASGQEEEGQAGEGQPPSGAEFAAYGRYLGIGERYPGVLAMGYSRWEETPGGSPRAVVFRIVPLTEVNRQVLGFDMLAEPTRREAILRTRAGDGFQASHPVRLVQGGGDGQPLGGLLLYVPVREGRDFQGVMYLALRLDEFTRGLLPAGAERGVQVRVRVDGQLLGTLPPDAQALSPAAFRRTIRLDRAGVRWDLEVTAPASFARDPVAALPAVVFVAGLLVAGLAFLLMQAQVRARERAERATRTLAESRAHLERSRAEFEAIFQAIQDAAAFADGEGRVRQVNRALGGQFGYAPGELIGEPLDRLHVDGRLTQRSTFQALTTPYRRADGSLFSGEAQRSEVVGAGGEVLGLLEVVRDVTERLEAERAVQAEERRSRAVLDAIPHILWVSDPAGTITDVNAQHRALLGEDRVRERVHPEDRADYEAMWARAYGARGETGCEVRLRVDRPGGRHASRWFVLRVAAIREEGGEVSEWVASATDIHDRLVAERLAQRNEERYRGVLEGMPQIVWLADTGGQPTYFNQRWEEYVGLERAHMGLLNLLHPEDRAEYQRRWTQAVAAGRPFEDEHRLLGAEGRYRTFVTRGLPVRGADSAVLEWVGTSTDVDDQVYSEAAARLLADVSERLSARTGSPLLDPAGHYRSALDLITERLVDRAGLWDMTPGPRLLAVSRADPAGLSPGLRAQVGAALREVVQSEDPLFVHPGAYPALHELNASGAVLYPLMGRDGSVRGVLGLAYRQQAADRDHELAYELAKRFATALDNDALRAQAESARAALEVLNQSLEERVTLRTLELREANRELEAFSYSVSHDLRTPLRHIVGFGDLLRRDVGAGLSPKGERYLGVITDAAARMTQLIDDLLEFSRMGRQELRRGPVDLGALVYDAWQNLEPDRAGRDVTLEVGALPTVQGDAALLSQVFSNLLSNAIKYTRTREEARVAVGAGQEGGEVTVVVRDNGVGFDPKYTDKLFGVFQRLHRAEEFEGTGIGLANVRRIVLRHGGRVRAEAVPGEGAAFFVTLPLRGPLDGHGQEVGA